MPHGKQYKDKRKSSGHRRRALFERVLREEDVCWLCLDPVDKSLRGARVLNPKTGRMTLHPDSPSLDEVRPVSMGGDPYDRSNVRLAHLHCNEERGDMDADEFRRKLRQKRQAAARQKPQHSRDW